ncbi:MAG: peptidoglycan DD-metalloendopeptidase family protein [Gammaproteobacteria bacterium]|nr:peptidoglycan DD-metalloendopeptidase family protein [Gammaproteobacteria bacterium]MDH5650821.1 peptidoglycan DD-metalloendopeptidase family protein [Gammaproteobacteria bacterium]
MMTSTTLCKTIGGCLAALLFLTPIQALALPQHNPIPGGVAIVDLPVSDETTPRVFFNQQRVMVRRVDNKWQAVIGIPLDIKPGSHLLTLMKKQGSKELAFKVKNKKYATRHITIPNERMVSPSEKDIERHFREKPLIIAALQTWTEQPEVESNFILPVKGRLTSPFGLKRIYNKQYDRIRRHTGLDIAAPTGTPVIAPARAKVIRIGDYFFTGNTVFLDHGQGLLSMYCHLSKVSVKEGDELKRGDRIGDVGSTGRVNGPHLHWVISLNNTKVEPKLFIDAR